MGDSKISLKLLIDTKNKKVLFAEAGKNCVDFLFHLLSLPLGTVIKLLRNQLMIGSLEKLYESVEDLDESYIQPSSKKDALLSPKLHAGAGGSASVALFAFNDPPPTKPKSKGFYKCRNSCTGSPVTSSDSSATDLAFGISVDQRRRAMYMSDDPRVICPGCFATISTEMIYVSNSEPESKEITVVDEGGFVKGVVTYMIMDDLQVKPMSAISSISLLNNFNVKDLGALEEKMVDLDIDEALKLLKVTLESKTVLTDVFLGAVRR